ncbi:MAG: CBS domain-containing protein [Saprospiraceae bacterium]|nr:CBS domain-containing protein [Saprospiraceae bacterium]MBK6564362.1 CBS domain-containing protein [Saprospiraceae bacterium]MBK6782529.1 CBS domain-containing protein [Saprospiraceae bacterium]MBK7523955.1 CBS domain-containing protein [Saprospiraceae bacterium]MBK8079077.1 CBS domain-containing protein [Saprospiraceae bacterium]
MIAKDLLVNDIVALRTSDIGEEVLSMMHLYHVRHLPIVNDKQLLGLISESDIVMNDMKESIGSYGLSLFKPYCFEKDHIFDVMGQVARFNLTLIPVIDEKSQFLGVITLEKLLHYFAESYAFEESGNVFTIETTEQNYSMGEICRIIESEGISVFSTFINKNTDSTKVFITVKTNAKENFRIKQTLERFGYDVTVSKGHDEYNESLKDRFDSLMTYLNV